jgi:[ribosomal protein S5]-alanine N-acetyltransferase
MWTVTMNRDRAGFAGFRSSEQGPELLFGFYPRYWHQGIATEAARAALVYLFDTLQLPSAWGATDPPNEASVRVMERVGCASIGGDCSKGATLCSS